MKPALAAILVFKMGMTLFQTDHLSEGSGPLDTCFFTSCVPGGASIPAPSASSILTYESTSLLSSPVMGPDSERAALRFGSSFWLHRDLLSNQRIQLSSPGRHTLSSSYSSGSAASDCTRRHIPGHQLHKQHGIQSLAVQRSPQAPCCPPEDCLV